jgi:hypothetical protein
MAEIVGAPSPLITGEKGEAFALSSSHLEVAGELDNPRGGAYSPGTAAVTVCARRLERRVG